MGDVVRFNRPRPKAAPPLEELDEDDLALLLEAYKTTAAAAQSYEDERRRERRLHARIAALMRENARLKAELKSRRQGSGPAVPPTV